MPFPRLSLLLASAVCLFAWALTAPATAQVFGTIINIPSDPDPGSIGSDTQLNLFVGGVIGADFIAGAADGSSTNIEVNITDGFVDVGFDAYAGTTVNLSGGGVNGIFDAFSGSTINISGGIMSSDFDASSGSTVNISGGSVGERLTSNGTVNLSGGVVRGGFTAGVGSTVNITGGTLSEGSIFTDSSAALSGSTVNISGGDVARDFQAESGSTINISGGRVRESLDAFSGSTINITGGIVDRDFTSFSGSTVNLSGGEFFLEGVPVAGLNNLGDSVGINIPVGSRLTATLADGTVLLLSTVRQDIIADGTLTLTKAALPSAPGVVNIPAGPEPRGLRTGQTLNLSDGGVLGDNFTVAPLSTLNINGGTVGSLLISAPDSTVNINGGFVAGELSANGTVNLSGGTVNRFLIAHPGSTVNITRGTMGPFLEAHSGSTVNISGGDVDNQIDAFAGGVMNLTGPSFTLDGVDLTPGLTLGVSTLITDRDVTLEGILTDGSPFSYDLNSTRVFSNDFFDPNATLTITLAPLTGDLNGDGFVGIEDLSIVLENWNQAVPPGDPLADPSGDGFVGIEDINIIVGNWNAGSPPPQVLALVPEPGTLALLGAAGFCGLKWRRRWGRSSSSQDAI